MCQLITGLVLVLGRLARQRALPRFPFHTSWPDSTAVEWPRHFIGAEVALDATSVTDDDPNHFGHVHRDPPPTATMAVHRAFL